MIEFILFIINFNKELFTKTSKGSTDFNNQNFNIVTFVIYLVLSTSLATSYFAVNKVIKLSMERIKLVKESKELEFNKKEVEELKNGMEGCKDIIRLMLPPTKEEIRANKKANEDKKKLEANQKFRDKAHQVSESDGK